MELRGAELGPAEDAGFVPVRIDTTRGTIELRHYLAPGSDAAVLLVGGAGGGWDSPAGDLYTRLGASLPQTGRAVVRVKLRLPADLAESVLDAMAAIAFL